MLRNPMTVAGPPVSRRRLKAAIKRAQAKAAAEQHYTCVVEDDNGRYCVLYAEAATPVPSPVSNWGVLYAKVAPDGTVTASEEA